MEASSTVNGLPAGKTYLLYLKSGPRNATFLAGETHATSPDLELSPPCLCLLGYGNIWSVRFCFWMDGTPPVESELIPAKLEEKKKPNILLP